MAQIDDGGSSGGRDVNVDINIIPFIDLMSVIIIFLLITAVWTQVSMIQLGSSVYGKQNVEAPQPARIDPPIPVEIFVSANRYIITLGKNKYSINKVEGEEGEMVYDRSTLFEQLKAFKQNNPDKKDAMITIADEVIYNDMIESMDVIMQSGFPEITVSTGGS